MHNALRAAHSRDQQWIMLAGMCTRIKVKFVCLRRLARCSMYKCGAQEVLRCLQAQALPPPDAKAPRRDQQERHRRPQAPGPARFFGQAAATNPAAGRALSRPRSAERSAGSLDRRSPPSRYTLSLPGRAGLLSLPPGRPWGQTGRRRRAQHTEAACGWRRARGRRRVGGGQSRNGRRAQGAQGDAGPWSPSRDREDRLP
jgi:hypothetical protein